MNSVPARWHPSWRSGIDTWATVLVVLVSVVVLWAKWTDYRDRPKPRSEPPVPGQPVVLADERTVGSLKSKVAVIEFSEFQCPFCGKFARDTFPILLSEYLDTGKVLWVFRDFPLERIHPLAMAASVAAGCASDQDRTLAMHTALFAEPQKLAKADLIEKASQAGLQMVQYKSCLDEPSRETKIRLAAGDAAKTYGISGTPTFFIGTLDGNSVQVRERFSGASSAEKFARSIDALLAESSVRASQR